MSRQIVAVLLAALAFSTGCSSESSKKGPELRKMPLAPNVTCATVDCMSYDVQPMIRMKSKYGTRCMGNTPPGTTPNPRPAPQSYLVSDIDKPDFPKLRPNESQLVRRIRKYVRSRFLRIAWL